MPYDLDALLERSTAELRALADDLGLPDRGLVWRDGLVAALAGHDAEPYGCGVLEVHGEGFGFLRSPYDGLLPGGDDIYVSQSQIKRFELRTGDTVIGRIRPPKEQERYPALLRVETINGEAPDAHITSFEAHTAVHPSVRLPIARDAWLAAVDWVAPLGLGARGLLVAPPREARAEVLRRLTDLLGPDDRFEVCALLVAERPEEATSWRERADALVVATPMDELPSRHLHVADIVFERARRLAERGAEVVLVVDGLTRLLRLASAEGASGPLVDGLDSHAVLRLRRWLASARDLRDGGSVTVIATLDDNPDDPLSMALLRDLGDVATWQLTLRPGMVGERPAIDVRRSFTRREDRLVPADELDRRRRWRAALDADPLAEAEALDALFRPAAVGSG